jgi:hypothetical protein
VAVSKDGLVAVAVEADPITAPGSVEIFDTDGNHLHSFPAGSLPDMLTFANDDKYLLVANEGEALSDDDDPDGSVTVIKLKKKLSKSRSGRPASPVSRVSASIGSPARASRSSRTPSPSTSPRAASAQPS